jgi:transposase
MKKQRRKHTAEFKAQVAIEAIRGVKTISEIAAEFEVHQVMVGSREKKMLEHLPKLLENKNAKREKDSEKETEQPHRKVIVS